MDSFDMEMQRDKFLKIFDNNIGEREGKESLREWLLSDDCDFLPHLRVQSTTAIMTAAFASIPLTFTKWLFAWNPYTGKISGSSIWC